MDNFVCGYIWNVSLMPEGNTYSYFKNATIHKCIHATTGMCGVVHMLESLTSNTITHKDKII